MISLQPFLQRTVALGLLLLSLSARAAGSSEVQDYLLRQGTIRIGVSSGAGYGHQVSARTALQRLRQVGYHGRIDVIYDASPFKNLNSKLATIFPEFDPVAPYSSAGQLHFITSDFFHAHPALFPRVDLALMGADDDDHRPADFDAAMLLTLQPLNWYSSPKLYWTSTSGPESVDLRELNDVPWFAAATPTVGSVNELGLIVSDRITRRKLDGLDLILRRRDTLGTAAFYGHGMYQGIHQLRTYLDAIAEAGAPQTLNKPIVVLSFIGINDREMDDLMMGSRNLIRADATDDTLDDLLARLRPGQILLLRVGATPPAVQDYFFQHSTLPPVTGGRHGMNLMGQSGRTYLSSNARQRTHFQIARPSLAGAVLNDVETLISRATRNLQNATRADESLARFISAALDPNSSLSVYYRAHRLRAFAEDDKFTRGLARVISCDRGPRLPPCEPLLVPARPAAKVSPSLYNDGFDDDGYDDDGCD